MAGTNIRITSDPSAVDSTVWEAWVNDHPGASVFHLPGMYEAYLATKNWEPVLLLALDDAGGMKGVLLAVIQGEPGLLMRRLTCRSVIFGGAAGDDILTVQTLLKAYMKQIRGRAIYTQVRNFTEPGEEVKKAYREAGFAFEDHLNIRVDLSLPEAEFWKGIKQNRKAGINKAKKQGFVFRVTTDDAVIEPFHRLLGSTYSKTGLPYPDISFFRALSEKLNGELRWFILE